MPKCRFLFLFFPQLVGFDSDVAESRWQREAAGYWKPFSNHLLRLWNCSLRLLCLVQSGRSTPFSWVPSSPRGTISSSIDKYLTWKVSRIQGTKLRGRDQEEYSYQLAMSIELPNEQQV